MTGEVRGLKTKSLTTEGTGEHREKLALPLQLALNDDDDWLSMTTISELAQRLRRREVSPVEITQECLARIDRLNPALNAFITVMGKSALAEARRSEAEILRGEWRGPLHGVPVALKDLIDTAGIRTTAASALYKDRIPTQDAEVVRRLRQAGAVLIGKNNLHE